MAYNSFPYSNFHELNLDYLLNKSKEIEGNVQETADNVLRATQQADRATQQANASANSAIASAQSAQASAQSASASAQSAQASAQSAEEARAAAGDPKTFTAAAQLTDTTKIYVYVGETGTYTYGHYYYYQAGSWHDGGVYGTWATDDALSDTSTNAVQNKVVTGAINSLKSDLDVYQESLFASYYPHTLVSGYYIKVSDGTQSSAPSFSFYNYVKVIPGTYVHLRNYAINTSDLVGIAFYRTATPVDFISSVAYDTLNGIDALVPVNAHYIRITVHNNCVSSFGYGSEVEPWIEQIEATANEAAEKSNIITLGKNLFNKETITAQRYLNTSGNPTYGANYNVSDFIPVDTTKIYQISNHWNAWAYNESKTGLRELTVNAYVPVDGDAYIRVTVANANLDVAQVEEGDYITKYQNYGYKIAKNELGFDCVSQEPTNFINKNVVVSGYLNPSNGNITNSANYRTTTFLRVDTNTIYTVTKPFVVCIYNADGSFSRKVDPYSAYKVCTFQPVNSEAFVRISCTLDNIDKVKLEKGIGWSEYTGSVSGVVSVDNIDGDIYKTTHVYVGADCFFTTINAANNAITDSDERNRYVIHIAKGTYNETFRTKNYVDYVGDNKHQCIIDYISDNEADYVNRSTIFAETNTRIAELTIKTTGSKYPIHADANYGLPYTVTIEDCIIQHDGYVDTSIAPGGTGIGIGLHYEQHVIVRRCIVGGTPNVTGVAAIYCHNDNQNNTKPISLLRRSLTIENSILKAATYGLRLESLETVDGQDNDLIYIGNINTCTTPFYLVPGTYDSWHMFGMLNEPALPT